jgi:molybdenum cofactor cytidylyltransferase
VIVIDRAANPLADEGMASSIRAGVERAGTDARILFLLCDQPRITADHLRALIAVDAPIAASGYAGIAGVPAIFAPRFVPELLALRGDRGARAIIERHREEVGVVVFEDAAFDVDEP